MNGPVDLSVSTRPAAFTAATSVVWSLELTALSTMSLVGYIGAPPTMGFSIFCAEAEAAPIEQKKARARSAKSLFIFVSILFLSFGLGGCPIGYTGRDDGQMMQEKKTVETKCWGKRLKCSSDWARFT